MLVQLYLSLMQGLEDTDSGLAPDQAGWSWGGSGGGVCPAISYGKIEPKTRKTDGFMALVAAFIVAEIKRDELTYYNMDGDMPDVVVY